MAMLSTHTVLILDTLSNELVNLIKWVVLISLAINFKFRVWSECLLLQNKGPVLNLFCVYWVKTFMILRSSNGIS